jgi:adenylate kinase
VLDEAREAYRPEIVVELQSNTPADIEENLARVLTWIAQWHKDRNSVNSRKRKAN